MYFLKYQIGLTESVFFRFRVQLNFRTPRVGTPGEIDVDKILGGNSAKTMQFFPYNLSSSATSYFTESPAKEYECVES